MNRLYQIIQKLLLIRTVLFLCISTPMTYNPLPCYYLAAQSQILSLPQLPENVKKMAVWEFLETLEPDQWHANSKYKILKLHQETQFKAIQIQLKKIPPNLDREIIKKGMGIICRDFSPLAFPIDAFELLFNKENHLIAIFPDLERVKADGDFLRHWKYFDLSPFYFEIPPIRDPKAKEKWNLLGKQWEKDQDLIERYITYRDVYRQKLRSMDEKQGFQLLKNKNPYILASLSKDDKNPSITIQGFNPIHYPADYITLNPLKHQIIIPVYPTVYSPEIFLKQDLPYYKAAYYGLKLSPLKTYQIKLGDSVLVGGTACGFDAWLTYLQTLEKVYVFGINPLEIANTKLLARIANFPIETEIFNNLKNPNKELVFPGKKFQYFKWNMPAYSPKPKITEDKKWGISFVSPEKEDKNLRDYWDHHFKEKDLLPFLQGLEQKLLPQGLALLWNKNEMRSPIKDPNFNQTNIKLYEQEGIARILSLFLLQNSATSQPYFPFMDSRAYTVEPYL